MNLELTDEQRLIQQVAREFAEKEVRPIAEAIDREARFPRETVARMGELGLLGIPWPEALGGAGLANADPRDSRAPVNGLPTEKTRSFRPFSQPSENGGEARTGAVFSTTATPVENSSQG